MSGEPGGLPDAGIPIDAGPKSTPVPRGPGGATDGQRTSVFGAPAADPDTKTNVLTGAGSSNEKAKEQGPNPPGSGEGQLGETEARGLTPQVVAATERQILDTPPPAGGPTSAMEHLAAIPVSQAEPQPPLSEDSTAEAAPTVSGKLTDTPKVGEVIARGEQHKVTGVSVAPGTDGVTLNFTTEDGSPVPAGIVRGTPEALLTRLQAGEHINGLNPAAEQMVVDRLRAVTQPNQADGSDGDGTDGRNLDGDAASVALHPAAESSGGMVPPDGGKPPATAAPGEPHEPGDGTGGPYSGQDGPDTRQVPEGDGISAAPVAPKEATSVAGSTKTEVTAAAKAAEQRDSAGGGTGEAHRAGPPPGRGDTDNSAPGEPNVAETPKDSPFAEDIKKQIEADEKKREEYRTKNPGKKLKESLKDYLTRITRQDDDKTDPNIDEVIKRLPHVVDYYNDKDAKGELKRQDRKDISLDRLREVYNHAKDYEAEEKRKQRNKEIDDGPGTPEEKAKAKKEASDQEILEQGKHHEFDKRSRIGRWVDGFMEGFSAMPVKEAGRKYKGLRNLYHTKYREKLWSHRLNKVSFGLLGKKMDKDELSTAHNALRLLRKARGEWLRKATWRGLLLLFLILGPAALFGSPFVVAHILLKVSKGMGQG